jgi:SAM-dependent methyltransferase
VTAQFLGQPFGQPSVQPSDQPIGTALVEQAFTSAFRGEGCSWIGLDETPRPVDAWTGAADASDLALLEHCHGSTLDIGCGPGRMSEMMALRGQVVLGIDVVPEAVFQTRERGAAALVRDVFDRIPAEGRWDTALLADGNIGIGANPIVLLRRVREVLAPTGRAVIDLAVPGTGIRVGTVRLETDGSLSEPFPWAAVGVDMAGYVAAEAGFCPPKISRFADRWYGVLEVGGA